MFRPSADAFTNQDHTARNYGDVPKISLNGTGGSQHFGYLDFSVKTLPNDAIISSASLVLTLRNDWPGTNTITARLITSRWSESRISYDNSPSTSGVGEATLVVTGGVAGDQIEIDVTTMISQVVAGAEFHGIRLHVDTADNRNVFAREFPQYPRKPRLVVEFGSTPSPPTSLHPRAGHAVNSDLPVLAWDVDDQSASWVQIATTDVGFDPDTGFPSPEFDDGGWMPNHDALYDLSTTAYGGVPDDEERFWTVAIQDEDGTATTFAEPARFERHTYGTFTIDSPTTDVDTNDPTILTTFTGRTLTRIDWVIQRLWPFVGPFGTPGWVDITDGTSDDDDFEIHGLRWRDATYRLVLKAFDEFPRGNVPNETAYMLARVEFVYIPGPTDPIDTLVLTQDGGSSPVVLAEFTRANAPDTFGIYCNGVLVDTVDSGDAFVSGTTYRWPVYAAAGYASNEIGVVATDDGEDSDMVSEDITPTVIGIWILAPDGDLRLPLFAIGGRDKVTTSLGEDGETFFPLRGDPVRIVDSVRGLEGTVSGDIVQVSAIGDGVDAASARQMLLDLKALGVGADIRIAFGRRNFPAILGQVGVDEGVGPEETYHVTVPFWEVPE
jgi:hypothetical protein